MTIQESIQSVEKSLDQIIETVEGLSEEIIRKHPVPEEWSIMQIICHVEEALPYWLAEIDNIKAAPGTEWGRHFTHAGRLAAVDAAETRAVSDVISELKAMKPFVSEKLAELDEATLAVESPSRNPNFGTKPIFFIVDHLIVEHASKHFGQIQRNLSKLQ
ncbi:DinB superfamily [Schinkia azotoformans MEV2011]|uniref:DinB superfamily n=1 Tax=Schinkia azotoformans MEV2011 TaxID=1348973 RepID=A0A072NRX1_SCHAZ|nr:DinB family protein [Schinkia azotoformans]KEF40206.1 DinB superfamily [Schinkia azotoformans MEV2011]MEC1694832.1 DinB family protein [Schinkia azotoformans]MEC1726515.1 DinB family protein [Schinkia azotoformans]